MKIIFFLLSIVFSTANAGMFDNRLNAFTCKSEDSAHSCRQCDPAIIKENNKVLNNFEYEFKVDKNANSVLMITYDLNKLDSSKFLDGCKVIDSKNWICKTESTYNTRIHIFSSSYEYKMTNGTFTKVSKDYKDGARSGGNYECAK